jgi:hypothetical protein
MRKLTVANPADPTGEALEVQVTDRAARYRAQSVLEDLPEASQTHCHFCGLPFDPTNRPKLAGHLDGDPQNVASENISPTCRPCNTVLGKRFAELEIGRLTRQYNPSFQPAGPLNSTAEYHRALTFLFTGNHAAVSRSIARIKLTPHSLRNKFAREITEAAL